MRSVLCVALLLAVVCHFAFTQSNTDEITSLPGLKDPIKFRHYAGYLTSNSTNGRNLFYWFVESQNDPANDPVVLWLNGGPGCSSLAGLMTEHGPYMVNADGKTLRINPYSWNKVANVIYLESPAGVGFSYSNTPSDYDHYNDVITANDSYQFLLNFFQKYPQFSKNQFFISGESFAGHYVPALAARVMDGNAQGGANINLKGIFVGNGCTLDETDANSIPPYMAQHSLIPMSQYEQGVKACNGDFYNNQQEPKCSRFLTEIWNNLNGINPYYLYDSCPVTPIAKVMAKKLPADDKMHPLFRMSRRRFSRAVQQRVSFDGRVSVEYDTPCVPDSSIAQYLNSDDVRQAIHATRPIAAGSWSVCNDEINEHYAWTYSSMLPFYDKLASIHIMVFTGDVDMVVNSLGTQMALDKLGRAVVSDWQSWKVPAEEGGFVIGGFHRKYSTPDTRGSLQFITVRGAGHMVGLSRPAANLEFFTRQLRNPGHFF